ncbi:MAG: sulfite exporter TauE/SafE family protein, partial [Actinomycetes bacterium]|nr:sulfite exporter TauE/SafE family protein [Actinomycetes bacterium]MDX5380598.1 sulfite exporter TauE/SafE family protein [Actinomycetes bacterium]MDX5399519.1 sulfite exporter TauE/SafE family protein [Actinomycetes bacterium]MDX5450341.1 sulfite exporter TauE/SafE family protein [Actinomycetes bacterium]
MSILAALPLGLVVGATLGALGGGGAILTVPALVYLLGQEPLAATTGSLVIVGVSALVGMIPHQRAGNVRTGQGLVFGLAGIVGSFGGSALSRQVDPTVLLVSFAGLMLAVAALMARRLWRGR